LPFHIITVASADSFARTFAANFDYVSEPLGLTKEDFLKGKGSFQKNDFKRKLNIISASRATSSLPAGPTRPGPNVIKKFTAVIHEFLK
jgi:hypothetical protein